VFAGDYAYPDLPFTDSSNINIIKCNWAPGGL